MLEFENNLSKVAVALKSLRYDEAIEIGKWVRDVFTDRETDSDRSDPGFWAQLLMDWADNELDGE